ncbi:hypothetical protein [Cellulosilyticum lentocellum]|uniref:FlgN family protein n=1 Tax=Cellulosilyticum lentocellum (strain ATCC 49066 / DSM 5427 / NCIMB 11756 / RHM5) TaxID=642492 RepID=F2JT32_CELLD|nr:hypothetical protein [Cellulosilyticum lentocellum]ADZ85251.1 hypothetical protein Clole_3568 [Cellulosilyticum lentocellum DSM 5427]
MESLFKSLDTIIEFLNQIKTLTDNQATVLLSNTSTVEEENNMLDLLEQMADYKEELTINLKKEEEIFQRLYDKSKSNLREQKEIERLQERVGYLLKLQNLIVEEEQKNLLLMQSRSKQRIDKVTLPINNSKVAEAYRKQQTKT